MTQLAYDIEGSGPVIALFHAGVCDRRMWDPQWRHLIDAGFRVLRFDLPGFGGSPVVADGENEAELVRDLLDGLGIDAVTAIGSSFGGRIAQEFAARWPGRVERLMLLCSPSELLVPTDDIRAVWAGEHEFLEKDDVDGATELMVETWVGPAGGEDARAHVREAQKRAFEVQLAAGDVRAREEEFDLGAITARTTVVQGAHDLPFFRATAPELVARIPGAQLIELDWAGHLPSMEDPAGFAPVLDAFLKA